MNESLESLRALVTAIEPITPEEMDAFLAIWKPVTGKRKELMTRPGEVEKHLYFVLEGVQRVFYLDEQDREATIVFTYPPSFGGVLDSFLLQKPSRYYFENLTASSFLRCSFAELVKRMQDFPSLERMVRKGLATSLEGVLERLVEIQCFSSEEKFRSLMKRSPHILALVPHKYLANYLGIDPTNFSKFINSVRI